MKAQISHFFKEHRGFILFVILIVVFRGGVADWHPVPTGSMKPTILEGDVIIVDKLAYDLQIPFTNISLLHLNQPKRGDIVVFTSKAADKRLIKRLIGLPGDKIMVKHNQLFVNGIAAHYDDIGATEVSPLREEDRESGIYSVESLGNDFRHAMQIKPMLPNHLKNFGPSVVPNNNYFVMGDNRDHSADSRVYGFVPHSEIRGKATKILLSLDANDQYQPRSERFWERLK